MSSFAWSWPRLGSHSTATFPDTGTRSTFFSVTAGTTTPVQLYSGDDTDREIFVQNTSDTYDIYLATHSGLSATSGPRLILRATQDLWTNNTNDLWVVAESSAGASGVEVLGSIEYDPKDVTQ